MPQIEKIMLDSCSATPKTPRNVFLRKNFSKKIILVPQFLRIALILVSVVRSFSQIYNWHYEFFPNAKLGACPSCAVYVKRFRTSDCMHILSRAEPGLDLSILDFFLD